MPRSTPRPRRGTPDETRARLVEAAAHVFNSDGYFATDSNKLARAAGYSPGTFYQHFADKRAIFLAAYQRWATDERQEITRALTAKAEGRSRAAQVARVVMTQHQRWATLRASLRALVLTDEVVRDFVTEERRAQLASLAAARRKSPGVEHTRADDWALLLYLERVADSVAWGEAKALGVSARGLEAALVRALEEYF